MSARAIWKGVLRISLVQIPIKVYPATDSSDGLAFHQLHQPCSTRIRQPKWCPSCAREVASDEIVKGYEFESGKYVVLSDKEIEQVRPPSARVIDVTQFADGDSLDPVHLDRAYYLAPEGGPAAANAYAVMREAMSASGTIGIGKLALYGREYLVAVRPQLWTVMLYTLHHAAEIRPVDAIEQLAAVTHVVKREEVKLARSVIAKFSRPIDLTLYTDEYKAGLQGIIDAKIAGKEIVVPPEIDAPPIVPLLEALTQSLQASVPKKVPAKVSIDTKSASKKKRAS